ELFYEIRHKTYATAWNLYKKQLLSDIIGQVFMSVTASIISATVEALLTATVIFAPIAHVSGTLAYLSVYLLMTKFSIDMKLHQAEAVTRSQAFYTISSDQRDPTSLNDRSIVDRVLKDSMAAALIGHPGGYYTQVSGGEPDNMYTGEVLVSPPTFGLSNINLIQKIVDFGGLLALLWENFVEMGESDPDSFTALDFDDTNLNFYLLTSELASYNQRADYSYRNADGIFHPSNQYFANSLGYLEMRVKTASNNQLDTIIPTNVDGRPSYQFINSTVHSLTLPQSVLYKPIVLSQDRYNELYSQNDPEPGHLVIAVRTKDYSNTRGMNPYNWNSTEQLAGYKAKIPLSNKQFEYPIQKISIDVIKQSGIIPSYDRKDIIINKSYYAIEEGTLYFTKSLEEIISEQYLEFEAVLQQSNLLTTSIYFNINILFDRIIKNTNASTNSLALAQATSYAIMDYFNQYMKAEVSANMISEIAYTETLTFWSTVISTPLAYFGALLATKAVGKMAAKAGADLTTKAWKNLMARRTSGMGLIIILKAAIKEVFQEIIEDGFIEALAENLVNLAGGNDDLGYWISALGTSRREVSGALGRIILGTSSSKANFKSKISLLAARITGNSKMEQKIKKQIDLDFTKKQIEADQKRAQMSTWRKFMNANTFKGIFMMTTSLFFGRISYITLVGFSSLIEGTVGITPQVYGEAKTMAHLK
ncbi:hypothetical protein LCGC14_2057640, partial [marine sediment metagenome]